ncbi:MAG: hypothetical protein QF719_06035 [Chloroflexota bacterium]|nr:hypothetical protein [Chloroflexota bacterium]MDP6508614.1 hypothetical protein [Chloroflexota bacterium]MDP6757758.1 hypothetical protein [Chloroflexota bacterium]
MKVQRSTPPGSLMAPSMMAVGSSAPRSMSATVAGAPGTGGSAPARWARPQLSTIGRARSVGMM